VSSARALAQRPVAIARVVHVEARVHRGGVALVHHARVQALQHEAPLALVRRDEHQPLGGRQVEVRERHLVARGRAREPVRRRLALLLEVEREERAAARVAQQDHAREALSQGADHAPHVQQEPLVQRVGVVVEMARGGSADRVAAQRQVWRGVVQLEVPTRVHEQQHRVGVTRQGTHVSVRQRREVELRGQRVSVERVHGEHLAAHARVARAKVGWVVELRRFGHGTLLGRGGAYRPAWAVVTTAGRGGPRSTGGRRGGSFRPP
jgi:hypothetical protein